MTPKTRTLGKNFTLLVLLLVLIGLVYSVISPFGGIQLPTWKWPYFNLPWGSYNLKGAERGRTNILILGSDYGVATDTIIVLSINYKTKTLSTLSLPRDLQITTATQTQKINSVFQSNISSGQTPPQSAIATAQTISNLINQPIDYWLKINIGGFTGVIDTLGVIEINVENSFGDCQFPTPNFDGYLSPCPEFTKGRAFMDSKTALIFARSRKSYNNPLEAIDFARSRRQAKVIEAVLNKVKSNPVLIPKILANLSDNLITDIPVVQLPNLISKYNAEGYTPGISNYSLDYDSGIICPEANSSDLVFCSGSKSIELLHRLAETGNISGSNIELNPAIQNLKIAIISNGSSDALSLITELKLLGINNQNLLINNSYQGIKQATNSSSETIKIYTTSTELTTLLKSQAGTNSDWQIINQKQSKYKLSGDYEAAEAVAVVE